MEITQEQQTVQAALSGSQAAYNALLGAYWKEVYTFLAARKLCPEDVEDLCIETFSKAFEKLGTYDAQYRFKPWLLRIAHNSYVDFIRRNAPLFSLFTRKLISRDDSGGAQNQSFDLSVAYDTPESELIFNQSMEHVIAAMEYLRPSYREALRLRYAEDLPVAEISRRMGITPSNVKVILMRARRVLLKGLE